MVCCGSTGVDGTLSVLLDAPPVLGPCTMSCASADAGTSASRSDTTDDAPEPPPRRRRSRAARRRGCCADRLAARLRTSKSTSVITDSASSPMPPVRDDALEDAPRAEADPARRARVAARAAAISSSASLQGVFSTGAPPPAPSRGLPTCSTAAAAALRRSHSAWAPRPWRSASVVEISESKLVSLSCAPLGALPPVRITASGRTSGTGGVGGGVVGIWWRWWGTVS